MKHKNVEMIKMKAEIIKAKADNMELVLLINIGGEWKKSQRDFPAINCLDYYLCHPKHVNACLHCLNGGEAYFKSDRYGESRTSLSSKCWEREHWYMKEDIESRIKPKKEKRWIVVNTSDEAAMTCCQTGIKVNSCSHAYLDEAGANYMASKYGGQPIEIEVEV